LTSFLVCRPFSCFLFFLFPTFSLLIIHSFLSCGPTFRFSFFLLFPYCPFLSFMWAALFSVCFLSDFFSQSYTKLK
jgi:hypothetical protein